MKELYFYTPAVENNPVGKGAFVKKLKRKVKGRSCVAGIYNEGTLVFGVSTCGNKDQFVKKIGRYIAHGRAVKKPVRVIEVKDVKQLTETFVENAKEILNDAI